MGRNSAQAAVEFLTTYAWAFMVLLTMIGALTYFGFLNPKGMLPEKCTIPSEFQCVDWYLSADAADITRNYIRIKLRNNIGEPITLNFTATSSSSTPVVCSRVYSYNFSTAEAKDVNTSSCNFATAGFVEGQKEKLLLTIRYYTVASGPNYLHEVVGEVSGTIQ